MTFIIAEMSANHGGSIDKAKEMIMAAKWAGCQAVKFQLYRKEDLPNTYDPALHVEMGLMIGQLGRYSERQSIPMVVSVFAWWAAEFLLDKAPYFPTYAIKFASPQSTRLESQTYERMARLIKERKHRLWVSTGARDLYLMTNLPADVIFYCPPGHPSSLDEEDLFRFRVMGFSDHSVGIKDALAAAKAGASHIEKHFMLDNDPNCVDAAFSITPDQMKILCDLCS